MSPRTFVTRAAGILALAAIGLAACEGKTIVQQNTPPLTISVSPTSVTLTSVGATAQIVALVTGGADGTAHTVTWTSSNSNVATVDANGVVTAKTAGTTSVIATATADQSVKAAAAVTVTLQQPQDTVPPTVSIKSITTNAGAAVNLQQVVGQINVTLNVDVPVGNTVSAVNWLIDGQNVCSQTFTSGSANQAQVAAATAVEMSCQINTADTTAAGVAKFVNGSHTLSATLVSGTTIKASTSQVLIFANPNVLNLTESFSAHAAAPDGFTWQGGNLTVTARPVMYDGSTVGRVNFVVTGACVVEETSRKASVKVFCGGPTYTDSVAPFSVTFAADTTIALPAASVFAGGQPLEGVLTPSLNVSANSVTTAGNEGPNQQLAGVKYDNAAPVFTAAATAPASGWVGLTNLSKSTFSAAANDEGGVSGPSGPGNLSSVIFTVEARDTGSETWTAYTSTSAIGDKDAASEEFRVKACDALGNCSYSVVPTAVGVDIEAPVIQFDVSNTVAANAKFNLTTSAAGVNYVVGFQDVGPSGFSTTTPVQVIEVSDSLGESVCVVGTEDTNPCDTPVLHDSNVPVDGDGTHQGYVTMTAFVEDRAGNKSPTLTRTVLVDYAAPVVDSASVTTAPLAGAASETFQAIVHDNLDAASAMGKLVYDGIFVDSLGVASLGTFGSDVFTTRAPASFTTPFLFRAVETAVGGTFVLPTSLDIVPKDVAGNVGATGSFTTLFGDLSAPSTDPFAGVTTTQAADSSAASLTATLTITGDAATVSPAAQVRFYNFNTTSGVVTLIGVATNPVITVNTTAHTATFTYTTTATATMKTTVPVLAFFTTSGGVALVQPITVVP